LGEVATFINGRAYSQDELQNSGKYKVLRVGNFYTNDSWYFSDMELDEKYYAKDGDLLYTWSATFGPHIWHGDKVIYHYHIWKVELSNILEKRFAVQLLEQDKDKILSDKNGSTMVHITKSGMEQKKVLLPPSIKEQANIGEYFSSIDHLITLHQQKITLLTKLKKAMLEKMFPKKGSVIPEIRFNGVANAWEQHKLGELVGIYDGVHQTPDYQDSGIMFLSVENIATLKSEKYITEEAFERDYKVYPEKGDILMTRIGDVGTTNVVETVEKVAFYVSLALLKPNGIDSYFLSNAMKINAFQKGLRERTLVTAIPQKINKDEIGKIDIFITNNDEEQKKIGAYFSNLDHLITLHQRKIDKIKNMKKAMLDQMFI
jgi:type I restriction enzyme, S subunit